MPQQTQKSSLLARIAAEGRQAHDKHKADKTMPGSGGLPAGINNGIAKLDKIGFGEYKTGDMKGKIYFMASAIVHQPKSVKVKNSDGSEYEVEVEGERTQIGPEPLCATPKRTRKTFADHYAWVLTHLRGLGVDTAKIKFDDLERVCSELSNKKPFLRFRTWAGQKQVIVQRAGKFYVQNENGTNQKGPYASEEAAKKVNPYVGSDPRVTHDWNGEMEGYNPGENGQAAAVEDHDAATEAADEITEGGEEAVAEEAATETAEGEVAAGEFDEFGDLDSLATAADDDKDEEAMEKLRAWAIEKGKSEEDVDNADSWAQVVGWIKGEEEGEEPEEAAEPWQPAKGELAHYYPVDAKTKKPFKKPVEVDVIAIDAKKGTCTVKSTKDPNKKWSGVKVSDLKEPVGE